MSERWISIYKKKKKKEKRRTTVDQNILTLVSDQYGGVSTTIFASSVIQSVETGTACDLLLCRLARKRYAAKPRKIFAFIKQFTLGVPVDDPELYIFFSG
jgi:hypothetical protein